MRTRSEWVFPRPPPHPLLFFSFVLNDDYRNVCLSLLPKFVPFNLLARPSLRPSIFGLPTLSFLTSGLHLVGFFFSSRTLARPVGVGWVDDFFGLR